MRAKLKPIREDEGLSWSKFVDATTPPPVAVSEPQPLAFATPTEQEEAARAPPEVYIRVETSTPHPRQIGR